MFNFLKTFLNRAWRAAIASRLKREVDRIDAQDLERFKSQVKAMIDRTLGLS
jgi:hypothetical protein